VIDTNDDQGKVERRDLGGFLTPDVRLFVAGRDRTKVVDEVVCQAAEVRRSISEFDVPVTAAVCLTGADWSFRARPFLVDGVLVCWPRRLATLLKRRGRVSVARRERLSDLLREHFPSYVGSLSGG